MPRPRRAPMRAQTYARHLFRLERARRDVDRAHRELIDGLDAMRAPARLTADDRLAAEVNAELAREAIGRLEALLRDSRDRYGVEEVVAR